MITHREAATIHEAMTKCQGDRPTVAAQLGMTEDDLAAKLRSNRDLAAMWIKARGPVATEDAYHRERPTSFDLVDPVDLGVPARDAKIADAIMKQEVALGKVDWEGMGITDDKTLSLMRQFEQGVGKGVLRLMDTMQGGMAFCFARVSRQFADVADELDRVEDARAKGHLHDDQGKAVDDNRVMQLHVRFMDLARLMRTFNGEVTNAAHTRLLIADRAKKMQNASARLRKAAWLDDKGTKNVTPPKPR
jgi:hypothetical protein